MLVLRNPRVKCVWSTSHLRRDLSIDIQSIKANDFKYVLTCFHFYVMTFQPGQKLFHSFWVRLLLFSRLLMVNATTPVRSLQHLSQSLTWLHLSDPSSTCHCHQHDNTCQTPPAPVTSSTLPHLSDPSSTCHCHQHDHTCQILPAPVTVINMTTHVAVTVTNMTTPLRSLQQPAQS